MSHLLEVNNLCTEFKEADGIVKAVNGVSYYIDKGEIVAFVGESGSGKSVTQYSGLQLIPTPPGKIVGGEVMYEGKDILKYSQKSKEIQDIRGGKISVVFQEPMTSLNPLMTVGQQIEESIKLHLKMERKQAHDRAVALLKQVGIPDAETNINNYPHQFSGGMRQRIMIAMAMSCEPKILIADEATTALDVTTQAQILEILRNVVKQTNTAMVMITHNLAIVARYADRIYVMYAGSIVESGKTDEIFKNPGHPYTIGLLNAVPGINDPKDRKLIPIEGHAPNLKHKKDICSFLPRCPYVSEHCSGVEPKLRAVDQEATHFAACHNKVNKSTVPAKIKVETTRKVKPMVNDSIDDDIILEVKSLRLHFPVYKGVFRRKVAVTKAVDGVSFRIHKGETFGLVGESGCGKTTVARTIMGLYHPTTGSINFLGHDLVKVTEKELRLLRRNISYIFQDPYGSLDPRQQAGDIVGEPLRNFKLVKSAKEYDDRINQLFELVGLDLDMRNRVPHEFSGGQRQRIGIARALATDPSFIVCDEAISALDVSIQAQIINILEDLQEKLGLTYLFIAHDLSVVRHISDRVAVMYLGQIMEISDWDQLYRNPLHPYTKALLEAVPVPDPELEHKRKREIIKGEVPSPIHRPSGCAFSNRCPLATPECSQAVPKLRIVEDGHGVACIQKCVTNF